MTAPPIAIATGIDDAYATNRPLAGPVSYEHARAVADDAAAVEAARSATSRRRPIRLNVMASRRNCIDPALPTELIPGTLRRLVCGQEGRELANVRRHTQKASNAVGAKSPYRDGMTHVIFEPEYFIARLVALVPKPRAHLTRYHGVFAPASPYRARIVLGIRTAAAN